MGRGTRVPRERVSVGAWFLRAWFSAVSEGVISVTAWILQERDFVVGACGCGS